MSEHIILPGRQFSSDEHDSNTDPHTMTDERIIISRTFSPGEHVAGTDPMCHWFDRQATFFHPDGKPRMFTEATWPIRHEMQRTSYMWRRSKAGVEATAVVQAEYDRGGDTSAIETHFHVHITDKDGQPVNRTCDCVQGDEEQYEREATQREQHAKSYPLFVEQFTRMLRCGDGSILTMPL